MHAGISSSPCWLSEFVQFFLWSLTCFACRRGDRALDVHEDGVDSHSVLCTRVETLNHVEAVGLTQVHVLDVSLCK